MKEKGQEYTKKKMNKIKNTMPDFNCNRCDIFTIHCSGIDGKTITCKKRKKNENPKANKQNTCKQKRFCDKMSK